MAHDVFISYASKDKTIADAVCARLEARGIRCWIAPRDVQPGQPYGEEIIDAIHNCRAMVLVLSSNANASVHIPKEIERAVSRGVPVIPLRVENVTPGKSLDYFISSVHWLDAITPPLEQHLESLATTIRVLLPESPRVVPAQVEPLPIQSSPKYQTPPPPASGTAGGKKPKWLIPTIAVVVAALAVGGWYFWAKPPDSDRSGPVTLPTQPRTQPPASSPGYSSYSSPDPILGCWHWFNNVQVAINSDGSMIAGPFTAHWQLADAGRRVYHFTWPPAVDTVTLSGDGRTLSGGNQYGVPMTAARLSFGPEIAGSWRWYNGVMVSIRPDGTFTAATISGRWQMTTPGAYALTWPNPVDTVTMSADHRRVSGSNQYGFHISGTKSGACGGS